MTEPTARTGLPVESEDRRIADRAPCVVEVAISDGESDFREARVLDLSPGGVKLLADPPPAPGEEVRLTFLAACGRLFQITATVIHYTEYGNGWAVGCRFARELNAKELDSLL